MSSVITKYIKKKRKEMFVSRKYKKFVNRCPYLINKELTPDIELTAEQKAKVDALWKPVGYQSNYVWNTWFTYITGEFDERYVPHEVFVALLLPMLNRQSRMIQAYKDKSQTNFFFPEMPFPKCVVSCVDGDLYHGYDPVTIDEAVELIEKNGIVFIKPSLDSFQGKGTAKWKAEEGKEKIKEHLTEYMKMTGNFVVQDAIKQHPMFAALNETSVNMFRVNTLRLNGEIKVLNATVRFGVPGAIADFKGPKGDECGNIVGVDLETGAMHDPVYHIETEPWSITPMKLSDFNGTDGAIIPAFKESIDLCVQMHRKLQHFDLIGFDLTIDENGKPVIIEYNMRPGAVFYQYVNGPFFGEYTEELVKSLTERGNVVKFETD